MVLANEGVLKPLTIRRRDTVPAGQRVLPRDVVREINRMLEHVVADGTGRAARVPFYRVAGKTGTVRKIDPQGGYLEGHYHSLFAGFAPINEPRFVVVIMIDDPQGKEYFGGQVAAPAFQEIMATVLRLYGVPADTEIDMREVVTAPTAVGGGA